MTVLEGGKSQSGECPVAIVQCPGECQYSAVLENIGIGSIVLDTRKQCVALHNHTATRLCTAAKMPMVYDYLINHLVNNEKRVNGDLHSRFQPIQVESHIFGYAVVETANGLVWIFIRDLTEQARLESIAAAVETMNNLGYVFSNVRHEIGNPLNSIKIALTVLQSQLDRCDKVFISEYIDRCLGEIARIEYLLLSLKAFSMFEQVVPENVDVAAFVNRFFTLAAPDPAITGITMWQKIDCEKEYAVADPRALQQVMLNVLSNAIDAIQGVTRPNITISVYCDERLVHLLVKDNGVGIPEEQQANLFKPFFTTKQKGTGLGLVIARRLLAMMGGTIEITSQADCGSTVAISLPKARDERLS